MKRALAFLSRNNVNSSLFRHAIDYGCGVGRLTVALARQFPSVTGIDVSDTHIDHARRYVADQGVTNVDFLTLRDLDELDPIGGADFVLSSIVLQHNPPPIIALILRKLLGVLNPAGCGYFQVPTFIQGFRFSAAEYLSKPSPQMEMNAIPQRAVYDIVRECGCDMIEVREDGAPGSARMVSHTFLVQRPVA